MSEWDAVELGDLGTVVTGRTPPSSRSECWGDKYPFITPTDMDGRKRVAATERWLSDEGAHVLRASLLPSRAVGVSCIGWQLGKVVMTTRKSFTNQQLNSVITHETVDPDFLYYALATRRHEIQNLASGGTRTPILNKSRFSRLKVRMPPFSIQRRVSSILGAYDDLIENNRRRIALLEQMAQAIYREWFVHFRYPGHEDDELVDSPLGLIPAEWEIKHLSEIARITMGQSPSSEHYNSDGDGKPFHQGVTHFGRHYPTHRQYCRIDGRLAEAGDHLVSVRAPVGRINRADVDLVIGRGLSALASRLVAQSLLGRQRTWRPVTAFTASHADRKLFKRHIKRS